MIRYLTVLVLTIALLPAWAQPVDTLSLREFEKVEWRLLQLRDFLPAQESDSATLEYYNHGSIVEMLSQATPLSVRNLGPSHSISISNRGLAAAHTAVYWQGVNINSHTTGIADFSLIPAAFVESMSVTLGGASSVMGSGLLGGGVHLNHRKNPHHPIEVSWTNTATSTQNYESSLRVHLSSGKWKSQTNVLVHRGSNHFNYIDHTKRDKPTATRQNSRFDQHGITQHLSRKIGKHIVGIDFWGVETNRELPPSLTAADNEERQYDRNLKVMLHSQLNFNRLQSRIQVGFFHDILKYSNANGVSSHISGEHWLANADFTFRLSTEWNLKFGTSNSLQRALAESNYSGMSEVLNNAVYGGASWTAANRKWAGSAVLRYENYREYRGALSPSFAWRYIPKQWMEWQLSLSRNYRVPAFNDRFWSPGGNPDLAPEDAYQASLGPNFNLLRQNNHHLTVKLNGFYNYVDNWIQWVPQGNYWGAVSYKTVYTTGFNADLKYHKQWDNWRIESDVNYVFTRALNIRSNYDETLANSQLPHMPANKVNGRLGLRWKSIGLYVDAAYVDSRFLSAKNQKLLEGYALANGGLSWAVPFEPFKILLSGRVHNIFNTDYQVMPWMPMPLRHYSISLKINFYKPKKNKP